MRHSKRWFQVLTILAGSSVLLSSGCGWAGGVVWFYGLLVAALGAGAIAVLVASNGTTSV